MVIHVVEQRVIKWMSGIDIEPLQLFHGEICFSIHYDVAPVSDSKISNFTPNFKWFTRQTAISTFWVY
jgi:exosome complex RNA-binding protein Rrp42 (RNase PH superfamily)